MSAYFPFALPLNKVLITIGFQELVFFRSLWKTPSAFLLHALAITSSVMVIGIPHYVGMKFSSCKLFQSSSSLVFPS